MSIFYLISMITLYISFLLVKKNDGKSDLLLHIVLNFVFLICYNIILTYFFTLVNIPITLLTYCIATFGISAYFFRCIIKNHEIQEYYLNKKEIYGLLFLMIVSIFVIVKNFNGSFSLAYETTDSNVHYMMAYAFSLDNSLLSKPDVIYPIYGSLNGMTISYVNIGLLFKGVSSFIDETAYYKIFILYDCFAYLLSISVFYVSIKGFFTNVNRLILGLVGTIIFSLGYPLSNLLFGFRYLGDTVMIINVLIIMLVYFEKKYEDMKLSQKVSLCVVIGVLNFCVFMGYYLFIPVVYSSVFLYFICYFWNKKKLFSREFIVVNVLTLGIPTVLGFIFFFTPLMKSGLPKSNGEAGILTTLATEGYIYRDLYSNFIFLIPFFFYYLFNSIKKKQVPFVLIFAIIQIGFIGILFIMGMFNLASSYYYFKNYFVIWIIMFYIMFFVLDDLLQNEKMVMYMNSVMLTVVALFLMVYTNFDGRVASRNLLFNVDSKAAKYLDIYATNIIYMEHQSKLDKYDLDALNYYRNHLTKKDMDDFTIPTIGDTQQRLWTFCLTLESPNKKNDNSFTPFYEDSYTLEEILELPNKYAISYTGLNDNDKEIIEKKGWKVIYKNKGAFILENIE